MIHKKYHKLKKCQNHYKPLVYGTIDSLQKCLTGGCKLKYVLIKQFLFCKVFIKLHMSRNSWMILTSILAPESGP